MSNVYVVYWSGTGNTQEMAMAIADGAKENGAEVTVWNVDEADIEELKKAKALALGCPSMGAEQLEEASMEPFMCDLDSQINGKTIALFGSYGWGDGQWMKDWEGPKRAEFIKGCADGLTGEQRFMIYSLERFLNLIGI